MTATGTSHHIIHTSLDEICYHTYVICVCHNKKNASPILHPSDGLQSEIPSGRNPGESHGYPEVLEQCNLPGN